MNGRYDQLVRAMAGSRYFSLTVRLMGHFGSTVRLMGHFGSHELTFDLDKVQLQLTNTHFFIFPYRSDQWHNNCC